VEEQIAVLEIFLVLCASNYFRHFYFYKTHAKSTGNMHSVAGSFFLPKQHSRGVHSDALGQHPDHLYFLHYLYLLMIVFQSNQMILDMHFKTQYSF
jgi:hypothetical protein